MAPRLLLVLACTLLVSELGLAEIGLMGKTHIKIINDIRDGLTLTFHCRSKDDDLGFHALAQNETWEFSFRAFSLGFSPMTRFTCDFWWPGQSRNFDIYDSWRDDIHCGDPDCTWKIRTDGPCLELTDYDICERWAT